MSPDDISGSAWFFETWSSKDGLAFASHRQVDPNGGVRRAVLATLFGPTCAVNCAAIEFDDLAKARISVISPSYFPS